VREGTEAPRGEKEIEHPQQQEGTWGHEDDQELRGAAKEQQNQRRPDDGECRSGEE
jgi:hypothetical protein